MAPGRRRTLLGAAWAVSALATIASLSLSGIPSLGWWGLGLPPCELCWYQRILMYPLVLVLGLATWRWEATIRILAVVMATAGVALAAYHSLIQRLPRLEIGLCGVGSCTSQLWQLGPLTIPNMSLIAFGLVAGLLGTVLWLERPHAEAPAAPVPS